MKYEKDGWIEEVFKKRNQPLPKWLQDRPVLPEPLKWVYEAFYRLGTCRASMGPIPWTAVIQYASYMGIDDQEEIEWFTTLIQSLDSTLLNELGKKADG